MRRTFIPGLIIAIAGLYGCFTETDTGGLGQISGRVVNPKGEPVAFASITANHLEAIDDWVEKNTISADALHKTAASKSARNMVCTCTKSDKDGHFTIPHLEFGTYALNIISDDNLGAMKTVTIGKNNSKTNLKKITVVPTGSLEGKFALDPNLSAKKRAIYIVELHTLAPIDSAGNYGITAIPPGQYHFKLYIDGNIMPSPLDSMQITIEKNKKTVVSATSAKNGNLTIILKVKEHG